MVYFNNPSYLVSGSPYTVDGEINYRLGTYVVTEQTAPTGYLKTNETFIITVNRNSAGDDTVTTYYDANGNNIGSTLEVGNVKIINEQVIRGGISGSKVLLESKDNKLGDIDLTGIKFAVVSDNDGKVVVYDANLLGMTANNSA